MQMQWLIACLCYMGTSQIHVLVPRYQHILKKVWCESGHFCWLSPCQFLSDWTGVRPMFSLCYGTMFLDSCMCFTFPLSYCPRSHGILHAFIAPSVHFHHVLRVCTTLLLCPQYDNVICTEFLLHIPHVLHSKTVKWIIALCMHLQFY